MLPDYGSSLAAVLPIFSIHRGEPPEQAREKLSSIHAPPYLTSIQTPEIYSSQAEL